MWGREMEAVGAGVRKLSCRREEQSERTERRCRGSAKKHSARVFGFLSRLISMSGSGRKGKNRAKGVAFFMLIFTFLQGSPNQPSVAPSTHSVIGDLSEIGRLPLGSADEVVLSIINQEIKKENSINIHNRQQINSNCLWSTL